MDTTTENDALLPKDFDCFVVEQRSANPIYQRLQKLVVQTLQGDSSCQAQAPALEECTREEALRRLLRLDCADILWVLDKVAAEYPLEVGYWAFRGVARQSENSWGNPALTSSCTKNKKGKVEPQAFTNQLLPPVPGLHSKNLDAYDPIVQFSTAMYYCRETEPFITVDVIRIGKHSGRSEVQFATCDGTAIAGSSYYATQGTIVFEPEETEKLIQIPLLYNQLWETTREFHLELSKDSVVGATLGKYLWTARVKVIDVNVFPSDAHSTEIKENRLKDVSMFGLFGSYFRLNLNNDVIKRGSLKIIILDQLHNLYFIWKLIMNIILVDVVFTKEDHSEDHPEGGLAMMQQHAFFQDKTVVLVSLIGVTIVFFILLHILDYRKFGWGVAGTSRGLLQKALVAKFLNYDETSRSKVRETQLESAICTDVHTVVACGYVNILSGVRSLGQLILLMVFQAALLSFMHKNFSIASVMPLVTIPCCMAVFLVVRKEVTTQALERVHAADCDLKTHVDQTVRNYQLIADYNRRNMFNDENGAKVKEFNQADASKCKVLLNNAYCAPWLALVHVSMYTFIGGLMVIDGELQLGLYLSNMGVLTEICMSVGNLYNVALEMQKVLPAFMHIVTYMNMAIDVPQRMKVNRERGEMTRKMRADLQRKKIEGLPLDNLRFRMSNTEYKYTAGSEISVLALNGALEVRQGELISLVGPAGGGKSTLLKIIAGVCFPNLENDGSQLFVPAHLRVLHVPAEPMFFHGTLLENLTFGATKGDSDVSMQRVVKICTRLGINDATLRYLECDQCLEWNEVISHTQSQLISIARALIFNPEVLCIHKPVQAFDNTVAVAVLAILRQFVKEKGIDQDPETSHFRRPRTVFMTNCSILGVQYADHIFHVCPAMGIRPFDRSSVAKIDLG